MMIEDGFNPRTQKNTYVYSPVPGELEYNSSTISYEVTKGGW